MKFAKLGFSTKEGLSLAHYSDGWSMEWGEGGSYHVEILFNNKVVAEATEEGNGGPLFLEYTSKNHKEVDDAVLTYLKRADESYGPDSEYDFCKNATEAGETEYASLIENLIEEHRRRKEANKSFKKGYAMMVFVDNGGVISSIASPDEDKEACNKFLKSKGYLKDKTKISYVTSRDLVPVI